MLWAKGEPFMPAGPEGVGTTTIAGQLALALIDVRPPELLGLPVAPCSRKVLYVAADRPKQAARSLRRMVGEGDAELLREHLVAWERPLPFDLTKSPMTSTSTPTPSNRPTGRAGS